MSSKIRPGVSSGKCEVVQKRAFCRGDGASRMAGPHGVNVREGAGL